jgi:hypothetical protein
MAFIILTASSGGNTQTFFDETTWSVDGGLSMPTGKAADAANLGFCVGFNGFYNFHPNLLIGARVGYNRWGGDEEKYEAGGDAADIDGHRSSFEILPQIRYLILPNEEEPINFFAQGGLGLYRMAYDIKVDYKSDELHDFSRDDASFELGICLGGGITLERGGLMYEIRPMYHIVFTEGDSFTYFTVTGGIAF